MTDPTVPLPQREGFSTALAEAMRLLEKAERTAAELRASLLGKHDPAAVEAALAWLVARRLLSDERAAEATVKPRAAGRRAEGDEKLRERMERRGASEEAIQQVLGDVPGEAARMHDALAAKFKAPDPTQRGKAGRFLLSRGFDEEAVHGALDRFFGGG